MSINKDTVEYVAKLGRIKIEDDKIADFTAQLDKILAYIEKLNELDTENTLPTSHALEISNVFREDEPRPSLDNAQALACAPEKEDGYFKVPKVI